MSPITVPAMRIFFLGMLIWSLPGIVPPFFGSALYPVTSVFTWLCNLVAVVCFFLAYRKSSSVQ